jgi:beta-glucosidase
MEGGHALADVVLGAVDATGRLPFTVPQDEAHLPPFDRDAKTVAYDGWHGWWLLERDRHDPRYPFGFGLSYTTFELGEFAAQRDDGDLVVQGVVRNTGQRSGSDVVQLYGGRRGARRRLLGFARVEVPADDAHEVTLQVAVERLAVRDSGARRWTVVPGTYDLFVARHSLDADARRLTVELS